VKILGRFVRGIPAHAEALETGEWQDPPNAEARLVSVTPDLRIAGGNRATQDIIQVVLQRYGWTVAVETQTKNPVERLEFGHALWRLSTVILPALVQEKVLTPDELRTLQPKLEAGLLAIARQRQAFDATEKVTPDTPSGKQATPNLSEIIQPGKSPSKKAGGTKPGIKLQGKNPAASGLQNTDTTLLNDLSQYAESLGLLGERDLFQELASRITP
jgi:hypothetical protein